MELPRFMIRAAFHPPRDEPAKLIALYESRNPRVVAALRR